MTPFRLASACALALSALVAGCAGSGYSGRDAELIRSQGQTGLALVSLEEREALLLARGREIVVVPVSGLCLDRKTIEIRRQHAFMLLADCPVDLTEVSLAGEADDSALELTLPPSFPGIVTISVAAVPLVENGEDDDGALDRLKAYLETPPGRESLARGASGQIEVIEFREIGDALYVLVQEENAGGGFLAPRYWRTFVELNDRLTTVTVSALAETSVGSDEMLARLANQTAALRAANGYAEKFEEIRLASAVAGADQERKALVKRTVRRSARASGPPSRSPLPEENPRIVAVKAVLPQAPPSRATSGPAPSEAPVAPPRPRA